MSRIFGIICTVLTFERNLDYAFQMKTYERLEGYFLRRTA